MARKSLSAQVMEEVERVREALKPLQDITDPLTSHTIGIALDGLHRVDTMCLSARQSDVSTVLADPPVVPQSRSRKSAGVHAAPKPAGARAPRTRKEA